jgi:tetratricopeptide (TPR) repeat protein
MKTINTIIISILFMGLIACNNAGSVNTKNESKGYAPLKERNKFLAKSEDWPGVKNKVSELFKNILADSNDQKSRLMLAQVYMQEARITGDHPYYYPATLKILEDIIKKDNNNFEALAFKASVLLSLHHFKEALEVGNKALMINRNNGFIYGVLVDANVELGNYDEAVKMSDLMQSIRPGLESYSRASYLREIYGDNTGSIEAMKLAFQAGLPGTEEASWSGNTLCHLYENTGNLKAAEEISKIVLQQRPSYAFATAALGRIEMANKNYKKAIQLLDSAILVMPEVSFYEHKAEALAKIGDKDGAKKVYAEILEMLKEDSESGHYVDMELAWIYLELGDTKNAMKFAKIEYDRRPNNLDVNHTMAWVNYKMGNFSEAKKYIDVAMRMGTQNAELLKNAGWIEQAAGNESLSKKYLAQASKINPTMTNDILKKS